ncbi:hypothetical protein TrVFT333_008096 [Trichoderma virens FT-333]|nr:hypothetical protein TrVFT333_008096 [Trichoderma virens FT-333]
MNDLSITFLFKGENFKEAENPYTSSAAMSVLLNEENLQMELYEQHERDESNNRIKYLVRNRIDNLYEILEKIIDYQRHITGKGGKLLHSAPRKDLEGWDFKDIATNEKHIEPRLAKIKTIGKGWIDFTRTLQATTLFSRGFGELIEPVTKRDVCSYWATLPSDKYYLAATMDDLSRIIDRLGNPSANPPLLTNSHAWVLSKRDSKLSCGCGKGKGGHCELTQTILPVQMAKGYTGDVPLPAGAVVFGHNSHVGKIWKDIGGPEDGDPPLSGEESDGDDPADSGVGPSIDSPPIIEQKHNPYKHEDYKIGIICALPKELAAVGASFDQYHPDLPRLGGDENFYCLGCIGIHNVVAACLPCDEYGISTAAGAASNMNRTFPGLKWLFVVGIGGGIPSKDHDIRLGDVIVSTKVIQHDMGKAMQKNFRFLRIANLQRPDRSLLNAISRIQANPDRSTNFLETHIQHILAKEPGYDSPSQNNDRLFEANFLHEDGQPTCQDCRGPEINRKPRTRTPHIHYGTIATGSQVVKNAALRDSIGAETGAICIEMEATGVMVTKGCLVIRGICDYADSHKNDDWHNYAAATAAAYLRYFLLETPP